MNDGEHKCAWCGEVYDDTELLKEKHLGYICRHCARGIEARGETLDIEES